MRIRFGVLCIFLAGSLLGQVFSTRPREVIVKFRAQAAPSAVNDVDRDQDIDDRHAIGGAGAMLLRSRSKDAQTLVRQLAARADVEYAEPNYDVYAIATPTDPYFGSLWALQNTGQSIQGTLGTAGADIDAALAWNTTSGSRANVVAVVDTGIDYTHPDLAANVWSAPYAFTVNIGGRSLTCPAGSHGFNAVAFTCDPMDDNNHGTHVSGTIGAQGNNGSGVAGVNWTASIMGTKFLNSSGSGTTADAVNAIEFAIQAKQIFGAAANVRVLSNSWGGGGYSQALLDEINRANAADMLFVAAAGNNGRNNDASPSYPASYGAANVIAVAATDNRDGLASFSNYGATSVDLGAPGVNILSTVRGGYAWYSGTSMATPHVSGAAALVLSACSLTTASLKSDLLNSVDPVSSLAGRTSTGGRLNVARAVANCGAPAPVGDFALSAAPSSVSINRGSTGSALVTVGALNGFTGSVALSVSGLPTGVGSQFAPNPVNGSGMSTLSLSVSRRTRSGAYPLTITGASGARSHTAAVTLIVP